MGHVRLEVELRAVHKLRMKSTNWAMHPALTLLLNSTWTAKSRDFNCRIFKCVFLGKTVHRAKDNSTMGRVIALHSANLGLIPGTSNGPPSLTRSDPQVWVRSKTWSPQDLTPAQKKKKIAWPELVDNIYWNQYIWYNALRKVYRKRD